MTSDYIFCQHKKGLPRIHFGVCSVCRRRKNCELFQEWLNRELGTGGEVDAVVVGKMKKAAAGPGAGKSWNV